jgi:hypothetical protein
MKQLTVLACVILAACSKGEEVTGKEDRYFHVRGKTPLELQYLVASVCGKDYEELLPQRQNLQLTWEWDVWCHKTKK